MSLIQPAACELLYAMYHPYQRLTHPCRRRNMKMPTKHYCGGVLKMYSAIAAEPS
ncbi:MAG: hypothetical protein DIU66_007680 [Bacillota bacterium]